MITIQNADAALKDYYLDAFTTQLNGDISPFFNAIEKTTANVAGKDVKLAIVKGTLGSIAAGDEDGELPSPYANRYYNVTAQLKNIYGTIEISDKALRASRESAGAFVNLLNAEMEGLVKSAKSNFARMLFGDVDGYLCGVLLTETEYSFSVTAAKNYYLGMKVDILKGTTVVYAGLTVTDVDLDNNLVYVDRDISEQSIEGGCSLYVSGAYGNELCGLEAIFGGESLYGYTKAENSYFKPVVFYTDGDALTESRIVSFIDDLEAKYDSKINMILCSHKRRKQIAELLADQRRFVNTTDVAAGFSSVVVNDVPVFADKFCPDDRIYFLNTEDFSLCQLCDWEWLEDEDGKILKQTAGKAAYSATLVKYAELICKRPCGQGVMNLT